MRSIVNISLPQDMTRFLEREVKAEHFASKSEFFRHLLRERMAKQLARELEDGRAEYKAGKTKVLKSSKDLWS